MRVYDFHGLRLGCSGGDALAAALHARLGRFADAGPGRCDVAFDYRFVGRGAQHVVEELRGRTRPVYDSPLGEVLYSDDADQMFISCERSIRIVCDPRRGETTISIAGADDEHLWLLSHPLFTLPLIETLKRRELHSLHAAGVAIGDKGLLFPGASGSGKSTLAVALVRAGFGFLGDDMLFLARGRDGLRALAFPEATDLKDDAARLFPELEDLFDVAKLPGWPKRQVCAEERFGADIVWRCRPVALVFPRVNGDRSTLTPLDPGEALLELVPNILLTESASSQAHLDALAELAATCQCYRLETGSDFSELAARLRGLVEAHG